MSLLLYAFPPVPPSSHVQPTSPNFPWTTNKYFKTAGAVWWICLIFINGFPYASTLPDHFWNWWTSISSWWILQIAHGWNGYPPLPVRTHSSNHWAVLLKSVDILVCCHPCEPGQYTAEPTLFGLYGLTSCLYLHLLHWGSADTELLAILLTSSPKSVAATGQVRVPIIFLFGINN